MYRSSPVRSTLNTNVITGLRMCQVCTEAVHCVSLWTRTLSQVGACVKYVPKQSMSKSPKNPSKSQNIVFQKKARSRVRGVFHGRRVPVCGNINIFESWDIVRWYFIFLLLIFLKHPTCRPPRARQTLQTALALSPPVGRGWQIILHSKKM